MLRTVAMVGRSARKEYCREAVQEVSQTVELKLKCYVWFQPVNPLRRGVKVLGAEIKVVHPTVGVVVSSRCDGGEWKTGRRRKQPSSESEVDCWG